VNIGRVWVHSGNQAQTTSPDLRLNFAQN